MDMERHLSEDCPQTARERQQGAPDAATIGKLSAASRKAATRFMPLAEAPIVPSTKRWESVPSGDLPRSEEPSLSLSVVDTVPRYPLVSTCISERAAIETFVPTVGLVQ